MGAKIIAFVRNQSQPYPVLNDLDFAQDSLFCEWAYVIDFDTNTFEVFKGFNRTPLTEGERFYKADKNVNQRISGLRCYPILNTKTIRFNGSLTASAIACLY